MNITVEFLSLPIITKIIGSRSISLSFSGNTIKDLLNEISNKYGEKVRNFLFDESGNFDMALRMHLNKKEWIYSDQMDKSLKDGDQITIMMLLGGG